VVQVYRVPGMGDKDLVLGAVGALQLEVLAHRLAGEYNVPARIEKLPYIHARWVKGEPGSPPVDVRHLEREDTKPVFDRDGNPVLLFKSDWAMRWTEQNHPRLKLLTAQSKSA
jgi:peptide chain release factor 3